MISTQDIQGIGMTSQRTRDRLVERLREKGIDNERVLDAISKVPRHLFVDEAMASRAYEDTALPIGEGQTISQPYVVALMTQAVMQDAIPKRILEVGTGCGYQAAILSRLVAEVVSVERIQRLCTQAKQLARRLNYRNLHIHHADGGWGWPDEAPYDAIVVTAAASQVPDALLEQLRPGGVLVIPVGEQHDAQRLNRIVKTEDGFEQQTIAPVSFVPFLAGKA